MRTLLLKTLEAVSGVFPQSGKSNIRLQKSGDGSGTLDILIAISGSTAINPSIVTIAGGVFITEGIESTTRSIISTAEVTLKIKVTGSHAYINFPRASNYWRETNRATRTANSPNVDYSSPIYRLSRYTQMFQGAQDNFSVAGISYNTLLPTQMPSMFADTLLFNQDLSWLDVSSVTEGASIFYGARAFNQDLSSWNVSNMTSMNNMFRNATSFNQDLSAWNFHLNATIGDFISLSGMSPANYSKLLIKLAARDWTGRTASKTFGAVGVKYDSSGADARALLVSGGWTILDGGQA